VSKKTLEGKFTVDRIYTKSKYGKIVDKFADTDSDTVEVNTFCDVPTATVGIKGGLTKNLGDFNNVRIDISVYLPTYLVEIDAAAAVAHAKLEELLIPRLDEFMDLIKDKGLI